MAHTLPSLAAKLDRFSRMGDPYIGQEKPDMIGEKHGRKD
jgi:hypothetical protein